MSEKRVHKNKDMEIICPKCKSILGWVNSENEELVDNFRVIAYVQPRANV